MVVRIEELLWFLFVRAILFVLHASRTTCEFVEWTMIHELEKVQKKKKTRDL